MDDTWAARDLPVLDAVVRLLEVKLPVRGNEIIEATALDEDAVGQALAALDGEYVGFRRALGSPGSWSILSVTPAARRAVGQWPTPESLVDRLAAAFRDAAEKEPDAEKKSRLRQVAGFLASAGRDVATDVVSKVIGHALGAG